MKVTLEAVARAIDGTVVGDGSVEITGVAGIREAREGELTFLANPRYEPYLELTQASAVIVSENHRNIGKPLIQNPNPYLAFLKAVRLFAGDAERPKCQNWSNSSRIPKNSRSSVDAFPKAS